MKLKVLAQLKDERAKLKKGKRTANTPFSFSIKPNSIVSIAIILTIGCGVIGCENQSETPSNSNSNRTQETPSNSSPPPVITSEEPEEPGTATTDSLNTALNTVGEIEEAIAKLQEMNPDQELQFPVEDDENYQIIGYRLGEDKYIGFNVRGVEEFLQESLKNNGKFPDNSEIELIVLNTTTQERLILKPINKNIVLGNFVKVINDK